jgi:pathogenesis-related protein 1
LYYIGRSHPASEYKYTATTKSCSSKKLIPLTTQITKGLQSPMASKVACLSLALVAFVLAAAPFAAAQNSPQDYVDPQNAARADVGVCPLSSDNVAATDSMQLHHAAYAASCRHTSMTHAYTGASCSIAARSGHGLNSLMLTTATRVAEPRLNVIRASGRACDGFIPNNDNVGVYVQSYAAKRQGDCALMHSGGPYGENIFWGSAGGDWSAADAVGSWLGEKQYYDHDTNSCAEGQMCGHYTQVVWRATTAVGCARVVCDNSAGVFIVCSYNPPGNVVGQSPY